MYEKMSSVFVYLAVYCKRNDHFVTKHNCCSLCFIQYMYTHVYSTHSVLLNVTVVDNAFSNTCVLDIDCVFVWFWKNTYFFF